MTKLRLVIVSGLGAAVAASAAVAAPAGSPAQHAAQAANEARAVQLQNQQEAVVRSTHQAIQARLPALKRVVSAANEKEAVETVRVALQAQAKVVHVATQRTMAELLQMLRRSMRQSPQDQLAARAANEARAVQLRARQDAVVGSTAELIRNRFSILEGVVSAANEKAAVDAARQALLAHANAVQAVTQRTMAELLPMLRV
jgi:hypothetical protein